MNTLHALPLYASTVTGKHLSPAPHSQPPHHLCSLSHSNCCLARNLDWELPQLRPLTINIKVPVTVTHVLLFLLPHLLTKRSKVMRNKQLLYYGTTFAGYVGILTAMRPGMMCMGV